MDFVRLSKTEMASTFGVTHRLAARVEYLLSQGVGLTEAALETAATDPALTKLLISRELSKIGADLSTESLRQLAAQMGTEEGEQLSVVVSGEYRVIALEEEALAEQAHHEPEEELSHTGSAFAVAKAGDPAASAGGTSGLFTDEEMEQLRMPPEEIAQLKLSALASSDPAEQVAALRKLVYAPVQAREKGGVFLRVLLDPTSQVRAEAVRALESIGFDPDVADAIGMIVEGDQKERSFAVQRIGTLMQDLPDTEARVAVRVLLSALREEAPADIHQSMLHSLAGVHGMLLANPADLKELIEVCMLRFLEDPGEMSQSVQETFRALADGDSEATTELLWRELQRTEDSQARTFLIAAVGQVPQDESRRQQLARAAVDELLRPETGEEQKIRLRYCITAIGSEAIPPLLDNIFVASPANQQAIIQITDSICAEKAVKPSIKNRAAQQFLELLRIADRHARQPVYVAALCRDLSLAMKVKRGLAQQLVVGLADLTHPDIIEHLGETLECLGEASIEPLLRYVDETAYDEKTDRVARVLGSTFAELPEVTDSARAKATSLAKICLRLFGDQSVSQGGFTVAAAQASVRGVMAAEFVAKLATGLLERLWKVPYSFDIIDALGIVASSRECPLPEKVAVVSTLTTLLEMEPPDSIGTTKETDEGTVYEFGHEIDFDTVVLPGVVRSLTTICLAEDTTEAIRDNVIKKFLGSWAVVSGWKVVWGPLAIETLATSLGRIGCHAVTPTEYRTHICRSLRQQISRISVVRSIGELFLTTDDSKELDAMALDIGHDMMGHWLVPDASEEERQLVLTSLAKIACREQLNTRTKPVRVFRERVLQLHFDALREGKIDVRQPLEMMSACPGFSKAQKEEIEDRLTRAYGLVKARS